MWPQKIGQYYKDDLCGCTMLVPVWYILVGQMENKWHYMACATDPKSHVANQPMIIVQCIHMAPPSTMTVNRLH